MAAMEAAAFLFGGAVMGEGHYRAENVTRDDVSNYWKQLDVKSLGC